MVYAIPLVLIAAFQSTSVRADVGDHQAEAEFAEVSLSGPATASMAPPTAPLASSPFAVSNPALSSYPSLPEETKRDWVGTPVDECPAELPAESSPRQGHIFYPIS